MGPRDLEEGKIEVTRRDEKTKEVIEFNGVEEVIEKLLVAIQDNLLDRAMKFRTANTRSVDSYDEFKTKLEAKGGFFLAHWDGTKETEEKIKKDTKATIRCIPLDREEEEGKCMVTGNKSAGRVVFAKSY
jgi:prolyl-tRNA synthetase